jgi:hypothetical protein
MKQKKSAPDDDMKEPMKTALGTGQWGGAQKPLDAPWTLEDRQRWQNDYECQKGQGDISLHSDEHLSATLDAGISMMRAMFKQNAEIVARGGDPAGVSFDEPYLYNVAAGVAILTKDRRECIAGFDGRATG